MGSHKFMLDDDFKEKFSLLALHCSEEAYKVAFLLNQHLGLRLLREEVDLDYSNEGLEVTFPIFRFNNNLQYITYYLVANKCRSTVANVQSSGGLFDSEENEKIITTFLIPEYKKVDYFLKIQSDFETVPSRMINSDINGIKQIISAYELDIETIKSTNNLIFD